MRSDERDFVDDMLDDVTGSPFGIPALAPAAAARFAEIQKAAGTPAPSSGGGGGAVVVQMRPGDAGSGTIKSTGMTDEQIRAAHPELAQQIASGAYGVKLMTPGSAPHLETPGLGDGGSGVLGGLASAVASITDPRLRQIVGGIRAMRVQAQATSEHAALSAQEAFRKDMTARLARIESRLPSGPLRAQVSTVRARIIPLLLG